MLSLIYAIKHWVAGEVLTAVARRLARALAVQGIGESAIAATGRELEAKADSR